MFPDWLLVWCNPSLTALKFSPVTVGSVVGFETVAEGTDAFEDTLAALEESLDDLEAGWIDGPSWATGNVPKIGDWPLEA
jgi:hypothetical protein